MYTMPNWDPNGESRVVTGGKPMKRVLPFYVLGLALFSWSTLAGDFTRAEWKNDEPSNAGYCRASAVTGFSAITEGKALKTGSAVETAAQTEKCSVQSQAPPVTYECGADKRKVQADCIYCSTPSGKRCGDKRCLSAYCACSPSLCTTGSTSCN